MADGAKWIWKNVAKYLPKRECVVDIFHVSEHLHSCGRSLYGDQTQEARQWADDRLDTILEPGTITLLRELKQTRSKTQDEAKQKALDSMIGYLTANVDGMWYRDRLRRGLPIGSGMGEGACKTVVGRRLKCNGARWEAPNANRMAALCCLLYSDHWQTYWTEQAA